MDRWHFQSGFMWRRSKIQDILLSWAFINWWTLQFIGWWSPQTACITELTTRMQVKSYHWFEKEQPATLHTVMCVHPLLKSHLRTTPKTLTGTGDVINSEWLMWLNTYKASAQMQPDTTRPTCASLVQLHTHLQSPPLSGRTTSPHTQTPP